LRRGNVLLVTEEDYLQISPNVGQCGDYEGSFQTWHVPYLHAGQYAKDNPNGQAGKGTMRSLDRCNTELLDSKTTTPAGAFCSAHYFDYNQPGFVAQGWYQQGTRILDVRDPRNIKQVGYFFTGAMETWAAYWVPVRNGRGQVTDRSSNLVDTVDAVRGIDATRVGLPSDQSPRAPSPSAPRSCRSGWRARRPSPPAPARSGAGCAAWPPKGLRQLGRSSSRRRAIGQAPDEVLHRTVWVNSATGSWTLRKETPASSPSSTTAACDSWSQNPRP
jgi:hypothetical protein